MVTQRPFEELNLWQRIFAEHWTGFVVGYEREQGVRVPEHWAENVERMLGCGDVREGYYEYYCQDCGTTKKVGFTCKSRLCLRCFKVAVDDWLNQAKKVLFEGVVHRQVVLTVPKTVRPLVVAEEEFLKAYMDAGALAVKELIEEWRRKQKIRVGIMAVLQLHGRAGNRNPHLHFVVSEGGIDQDNTWREVKFFDTKKLRKKWQYHVITALKQAVREKIHALVADALKALVRRAAQVAEYFARKRGVSAAPYRQKLEERFGKGELRCAACGSTKMLLIRIWSKEAGVVYERRRDGLADGPIEPRGLPVVSKPGPREPFALAL